MYQLIKKILLSPKEKTKISLYYLNKTPSDILLRRELDLLEKQHPDRLRITYGIDQYKFRNQEEKKPFAVGKPTSATLSSILPNPDLKDDCCVLVCGPDG